MSITNGVLLHNFNVGIYGSTRCVYIATLVVLSMQRCTADNNKIMKLFPEYRYDELADNTGKLHQMLLWRVGKIT